MKIGLIQMAAGMDKQANLEKAAAQVAACKDQGADLAALPEIFNGPYSNDYFRQYAEPQGGRSWQALSRMAAEQKIWLVGGSIPEIDEAGRVYNTSFVFDDQGRQVARHRKVHLFDVDIEGGQYFKESDTFTPGSQATVFDTPWGKIGLCICFDFRFPQLAWQMTKQGARIIVVPAAFNMTTGPAHWELLFRQRAVDNQCFTVGVSPARDETASYVAYGHSIAVDPWGSILCQAGSGEATLYADLNLRRVESVRRQLPILSARRTDLYEVRQR